MTAPRLNPETARRVDALLKRRGGSGVDAAAIAAVVESVMASMEGDLSAVNLKLYAELEGLARYIADAKAEIATDELEAIVGATEQATNSILEAAETIEAMTGRMEPEVSGRVTEAVTRVYEACNFQDITGQRITKIVKALQHIEAKVDALLAAFGEEIEAYKRANPVPAEERASDGALLNGPQLPDEAAKQAEIDALLASLD